MYVSRQRCFRRAVFARGVRPLGRLIWSAALVGVLTRASRSLGPVLALGLRPRPEPLAYVRRRLLSAPVRSRRRGPRNRLKRAPAPGEPETAREPPERWCPLPPTSWGRGRHSGAREVARDRTPATSRALPALEQEVQERRAVPWGRSCRRTRAGTRPSGSDGGESTSPNPVAT